MRARPALTVKVEETLFPWPLVVMVAVVGSSLDILLESLIIEEMSLMGLGFGFQKQLLNGKYVIKGNQGNNQIISR